MGSEMCIRDSGKSIADDDAVQVRQEDALAGEGAEGAGFFRAVSSLKCNTGLQAHDFASEDLGRGFESEAFSRAVV